MARLNQANQTFAAPLAIDGDTEIAVDGASEQLHVAATRGAAGFTENMLLTLTNNSTGGGQDIAELANAAGTSATESILRLNNLDPDTAVTDGLVVESLAGGITTAVDASDPEVGTALEIGNNDLKTSSATISAAELEELDGDPSRSINLPLGGFTTIGIGPIDFSSGADGAPDFVNVAGAPVLEYDLTVGSPDTTQLGRPSTSFIVPADYASGGQLKLRVQKLAETGNADGVLCETFVDGPTTGASFPSISGTAIQTITASVTGTFGPGDAVVMTCGAQPPTDNVIRLHAVEFSYAATR